MKLSLLNINNFIEKNKLKEVTSIRIESKNGLDPDGLFSEVIFGRLGSKERRETFGYINLNIKVIHPECWDFIIGLNPMIGKLVTNKAVYQIADNGDLVEDESKLNGQSGVKFLIDNWDKLNLALIGKNHLDYVKYLKKNSDLIFIDKFLVLPAGTRDIQKNKLSGKSMIQSSEINALYQTLLSKVKMVNPEALNFLSDDVVNPIINDIQRRVIEINDWIKDRMKGKTGLIRGGLLSKTVDYSGRFAITGSPNMPLGSLGLPFQDVLKMYEPFFIHEVLKNGLNAHVLELIRENLNKEGTPDINDLKRFLTTLVEYPDSINPLLKDELVRIAKEIVTDKLVIYKRDRATRF